MLIKLLVALSNWKAEAIVNESHFDDSGLIQNSGRIIDWVKDHNINISKYNPLAGSIYIKLPKELDYPRKGLDIIQNIDDNACFELCLVRYLHPPDRNQQQVQKLTKVLQKKLIFKAWKFMWKLEILTKLKNRILLALALLIMKKK